MEEKNVILAKKRTLLAGTRTLLAFVRTAVVCISLAIAIIKLDRNQTIDAFTIGLFVLSGLFLITGIIDFVSVKKQVDKV